MQIYTKTYFKAFGIAETDFVACECCEGRSTEIHHLLGRKGELLNDIRNLMAICRTCHDDYGQIKVFVVYLLKIHRRRMDLAGVKYNNSFFKENIEKYSIHE